MAVYCKITFGSAISIDERDSLMISWTLWPLLCFMDLRTNSHQCLIELLV